MVDNPYNGADTRERLLNNAINIKFERDRYTTPITIEFRQKQDKGSINPAKLHRDLFAEILLIDTTTKIISNNGTIFTHPKELPLGTEYASSSTEATIHNQKFNSVKAYICCNIETAIPYKIFLYSTNGDKTILPLLKSNNMWLKWNKFSTHSEVSIGFIKFVNPNITLQTAVRSIIELTLCSMTITSEETKNFSRSTDGKKRKATTELEFEDIPTNQFQDGSECEPIQLPAFDISMKRVGYGNGKRRVSIMAFEVKCHPDNAAILKRLLFRASASDDKPPNNDNIHFVAYGLPQYTTSELYRT